jgi:hypothetical protein
MGNSLERRVTALEKRTGEGKVICVWLHPDPAENEKRLTDVKATCGPLDQVIAHGWKRPHPRCEEFCD